MSKFEKEIKAYALKNAIEFGKADVSKVLPKLFQHGLKKEKIKLVVEEIKKIVKEINKLKDSEKEKEYDKVKDIVKVKEEKKKELPELPGIVKGKTPVLRVAPFPSGAMHLGNAKTFILNFLYAEKYKGKLLLVIDDTIGSKEKPIEEEAYNLIRDGFDWLGIKFSGKTIYKSDRLRIYYKYAKELIKKNKAYACHCSQEEVQKNRREGKECGCRQFPVKIQILRWGEMFKMKEGHGTLRIKTSMLDKDPAFRDRVLFKISDREHVRVGKKYRVWPTLEMSWAIDDYLLGITHIIRGNDLTIESDMEKYIWDIFGWKHPFIFHTGLVQIEGIKIAKSKSRKEVKSGEFAGWDDPRTWSIQSLMRRGISAEALRKFVEEIGLNKQDITVPIETLYSINRKVIDKKADRYSFVVNPVKLEIEKNPGWTEREIPMHPDKTKTRKVKLGDIFIPRDDFDRFAGKEIRLLHLFNVELPKKTSGKSKVVSIDDTKPKKINWVSDFVHCKVLMDSGSFLKGIADSSIKKLKTGEVVQFERMSFCRFDGIIKERGKEVYEFWFAHH